MDNFPDWDIFQERETLHSASEVLSPVAELVASLHQSNRLLEQTRQELLDLEQSGFTELTRLAVLVVQLQTLLERNAALFPVQPATSQEKALARFGKSLHIIEKQLLDALRQAGLELEVPFHKTYAEVAEDVEIDQWHHLPDLTEEIVIDVLEPILRKGKLWRAGRVIMGAPLQAEPGSAEEDAETTLEKEEQAHE